MVNYNTAIVEDFCEKCKDFFGDGGLVGVGCLVLGVWYWVLVVGC